MKKLSSFSSEIGKKDSSDKLVNETKSMKPSIGIINAKRILHEEEIEEEKYHKKNLGRLAIVKKRREADRIKRELEGRNPGWRPNGIPDSDSDNEVTDFSDDNKNIQYRKFNDQILPKFNKHKSDDLKYLETLSNIEIKKLNVDGLIYALNRRGLPYDGQKKDLIKRLTDYENSQDKNGYRDYYTNNRDYTNKKKSIDDLWREAIKEINNIKTPNANFPLPKGPFQKPRTFKNGGNKKKNKTRKNKYKKI
jgi:hypothetical protein